jgi:hypothetical protein
MAAPQDDDLTAMDLLSHKKWPGHCPAIQRLVSTCQPPDLSEQV